MKVQAEKEYDIPNRLVSRDRKIQRESEFKSQNRNCKK